MEEKNIVDLYQNAKDKDKTTFKESIKTTLKVHKDIEKVVKDTEWIDKIEFTIPYIFNILMHPNRFIVNEEEIVRIEKARRVTVESIKHLSRNTSFIQKIEANGDVKPSKILNINKEENYDTYENRLIYTLIQNLRLFVMRKKKFVEALDKSDDKKDDKSIEYSGTSKVDGHSVEINLSFKSSLDNSSQKLRNNDVKDMMKRLENIEMKILDLTSTEVYKMLDKKHVALITGAIKKTNLILKNVNFQYAMSLWTYLQTHMNDSTATQKDKDDYEDKDGLRDLMNDSFFLNYLIVKTIDEEENENDEEAKRKQEEKEMLMNKMLENIIELNPNLTKEDLEKMVGEKFVVVRYRNMVTMKEIQNIFEKHINDFVERTMTVNNMITSKKE